MVMVMHKMKNGLARQKGSGILEVLIAILIFAVGMTAMTQLQGRLTRSSADANVRTVAVNIAEETIEALRSFALMDTDPAGVIPAYADISTTAAIPVPRGNARYSVTTTVSDWYYDKASGSFLDSSSYFALSPTPKDIYSDFKMVSVNVSWAGAQPWLIDERSSFTGASGITLSSVISSMTTGSAGKVTTQNDAEAFEAFVDYTPGHNPDIISLALGDDRFRESLTPKPEVYRANELVETSFEVMTYTTASGNPKLIRAEEIAAVSCECTLEAPPGNPENAGRRPTIWAGDEYSEAHFVNKAYGTPSLATTQQSPFCDVCCQDHHDGGSHADDDETATTRYDPFPNSSRQYWSSGPFAGDHKHYYPDRNGALVEVDGSARNKTYMESCALVRKDGFVRVMQDFNQEGVNAFAQEFLDETSEAQVYGGYVTGAVSTYVAAVSPGYESAPPTLQPANNLWSDSTSLTDLSPTQQLSNRGIYLGYLSTDLQSVIDCAQRDPIPAGGCESGDIRLDRTGNTNVLDLVPFFDLQLTSLSRWNEAPVNNPVDTTNEAVRSGNIHSRGLASSPENRRGMSLVSANGHPGNIGLTDTDPIELNFTTTAAEINVQSLIGTGGGTNPNQTIISGDITSSIGGNLSASSITVTASDAQCNRTVDGFICAITGASPTITLSGYGKNTPSDLIDRVACSIGLTKTGESFFDIDPWAIFSLTGASGVVHYTINIKRGTSC